MSGEIVLRANALYTPGQTVLTPAELAFSTDTGRITYVGAPRESSVVTHDLAGHVLMPGLTNGHTHSAMTLQRGVSDDEGFMPWLEAVQNLEQGLTHEDIEVGLELALLEMIETGTTAFADMYFWDESLIETVRAAGLRAFAALACTAPDHIAYPNVASRTGQDELDHVEALAAQYRDDPQVVVGYGPHAPYSCPPEFYREIAARAIRSDIPIHTHVAESPAEMADIRERYGVSPPEHLASLGVLDAQVLAAHCVHLGASDIAMMVDQQIAMSHNPVSNLKLGNGIAPLPELIEAGARLCIGTDGMASNNSLDLFEEVKLATILHRGARHDAAIVRASQVLEIATRRGAEASMFRESGALEVGRFADVIALDLAGASATPLIMADQPEALISHLAFAATGADVRHVFVGGRHLYADGEHLTLDAAGIRERAVAARTRLSRREAE